MSRWPEKRNAKQACGCCRRKTVLILVDGVGRLCACDPDAPTCPQCCRGRCCCRCVPARIPDAPTPPRTWQAVELGVGR